MIGPILAPLMASFSNNIDLQIREWLLALRAKIVQIDAQCLKEDTVWEVANETELQAAFDEIPPNLCGHTATIRIMNDFSFTTQISCSYKDGGRLVIDGQYNTLTHLGEGYIFIEGCKDVRFQNLNMHSDSTDIGSYGSMMVVATTEYVGWFNGQITAPNGQPWRTYFAITFTACGHAYVESIQGHGWHSLFRFDQTVGRFRSISHIAGFDKYLYQVSGIATHVFKTTANPDVPGAFGVASILNGEYTT